MENTAAKHDVSNDALEKLREVMYKQDEYGVKKYGKSLNSFDQYNWLDMFFEEMADGLKYLQCEVERKNYVIQMLQAGLRSNEPKQYIEIALEMLTVEGTGK